MEKAADIGALIQETEQKLVDALNNSHLHPSVLMLIMRNLMNQLQAVSIQADASTCKPEGENYGGADS